MTHFKEPSVDRVELKGWPLLDGFPMDLMSLAWPLVTLAIALIFRQDVTRALARVGRLKYRDLEVTFRDDLRQAENLARALPPAPPAQGSILLEIESGKGQPFVRKLTKADGLGDERQALLKLATTSPRKAVEAAGNLVGRALARADRSRLADAEARLAETLQGLRDRAVPLETDPPTSDEARRFVDLACQLASRIDARG